MSNSFTRRVSTWRGAVLDSLSLLHRKNFSLSTKLTLPADCGEQPDLALACHPLGAWLGLGSNSQRMTGLEDSIYKNTGFGISLAVQRLRLRLQMQDVGSIPCQGLRYHRLQSTKKNFFKFFKIIKNTDFEGKGLKI